jgi:MFS family permease
MTHALRETASRAGTWAALSGPVFRVFWLGSFLAFIGASMQSVGAGWLMTQLDGSALLVSFVQSAFTLSQFMMAVPAGVIADLVDRRWIMLGALGCMMLIAIALGLVTIGGYIGPFRLIALTFLFGLAASALTPSMQATTPDLVSRDLLPSALTLNGMTVSVARAVGPGMAGLILGWWGAGSMFLLNALAFVGLFLAIARWRDRPPVVAHADPRFWPALKAGLEFSIRQKPLRQLLVKSSCNFIALSILLALLPAVVAQQLGGRPQTLGLLLACFGMGSVLGSLALSRFYARWTRSRVIDLANMGHGLAVLGIGFSVNPYASAAAMLLAGLCWTSILTSVNIVVQMLLPASFRARGLAINMTGMMGSMTLGAAFWGLVAQQFGLRTALLVAGVMGVLMPALTSRLRLVEQLDDASVPPGRAAGGDPG